MAHGSTWRHLVPMDKKHTNARCRNPDPEDIRNIRVSRAASLAQGSTDEDGADNAHAHASGGEPNNQIELGRGALSGESSNSVEESIHQRGSYYTYHQNRHC
jgi:hypothetical protein